MSMSGNFLYSITATLNDDGEWSYTIKSERGVKFSGLSYDQALEFLRIDGVSGPVTAIREAREEFGGKEYVL